MSNGYALSSDLFELAEQNDRRFKRLLKIFGIPALILAIVIPFLQITEVLDDVIEPVKRLAKLLPEMPKPEPPKPKPEEPIKPKPQPKAELTDDQKLAKAKQKIDKMRQTFDELSALRDQTLPTAPAQLNTQLITSNVASTRSVDVTKTSGGIGDTAVVDRNATTNVGSRSTTSVESGIRTGTGTGGGEGGRALARSLEEIQVVFDRTKGAFYAIYTREQRQRPDMVGKMVVRLTILPSGKVKSAKLVSSELNNPEFEQKIIARILLMDFGPKDVGDFTIDYPLIFFPA